MTLGFGTVKLGWALRAAGSGAVPIKGDAARAEGEGLYPAFSASGQDIWLPKPQHSGPGLVLSSVGARCGKVFEASGKWGVVANTTVLVPQPGYDAHFLWYLTNDELFWERGGTAQPYVRVPETLARRIPMPSFDQQLRIAAFLDDETARIDALITAKQRMIGLVRSRQAAELESLFAETGAGVPLKHLLARPLAYGVLIPEFVDDGVPMLRIMDLTGGQPDMATVRRIPERLSNEYKRTIVEDGDLVVSVVGSMGVAARIDERAEGSNLNRALARVALAGEIPRSLVLWWFRSERFMLQARLATGSGSAQPTLNLGDLREFRVPINPDGATDRYVKLIDESAIRCRATTDTLTRQIELLRERRHALITAAVTGELEI